MNPSRFFRASLVASAAGVALSAGACLAASQTYTATFTPANNSGVTGTASVTLNGDELTYSVSATGLEPNKFHQEHIHGFLNPNDKPSQLPVLPRDDKNGNGMLDDLEGEAVIGGPILYLTASPAANEGNTFSDFPVADAKGNLNFKQTYDVTDYLVFLQPLEIRGIELHGKTVDGDYMADLPVASGLLRLSSGGTGGTGGSGGGGTAVPLPAGVWTGGLLLGLTGAATLKKRRTSLA